MRWKHQQKRLLILILILFFETSGDAMGLRFSAQVAQTSGSLTAYVYCTAVTGSPTAMNCQVRKGVQAASAPASTIGPEGGGSQLGTPGSDTDFSSAAGSWVELSAVTGVTLELGKTYHMLIENKTTTPASNYPTIINETFLDGNYDQTYIGGIVYETDDGFVSAATDEKARLSKIAFKI